MKRIILVIQLVFLFLFVLQISSCKKETALPSILVPEPANQMCEPQIMAYSFGVEHYPIAKQVRVLDSLGMGGMILNVELNKAADLALYYQTPQMQSDSFKLFDVFTYVSLTDTVLKKQQMATIEAIFQQIQFRDTRLQIIFHGENQDPLSTIIEIADIASTYNKSFIIYPHHKTAIITAEDALVHIKASQKNNVFLAVHLCHELSAGYGDRIEEVIANVSPYIKSVSISGATTSEQFDTSLPAWYWAIKPLYMGTYDFTDFYNALHANKYRGPIAIHTWGIFNNFGLTPEEHLPGSKAVLLQLADDACQ